MPELIVCLDRLAVGRLSVAADGLWQFAYNGQGGGDSGSRRTSRPVSLALPRHQHHFHPETVSAVFGSLLPDGSLRQRVARSLGLSQANDFALLERLGQEGPGALTFYQSGGLPLESPPERVLNDKELRDLVAALPVQPLLADVDGLAKTLPGEFDKLPVKLDESGGRVVLGGQLTTHILKTAKPGLRETVMNEAFCMALAAAAGLPVSSARVLRGSSNVLLVTRVDRVHGASVLPVHMEDFGQALGYPAMRRYEREGGARVADLAHLLRACSTRPGVDIKALMHWLMFSFLIGFGAGHARQLALLHEEDGVRLAPFFGIWSTHIYSEMSYRMGVMIGREDRPDWLSPQRWLECGEDLGVRPRFVVEHLRQMAAQLPPLAREVGEAFQRQNGFAEIVKAIQSLISQRARQVLVALEVGGAL